MNYGFNPNLEREHQQGDEWQFGSTSTPCIAPIPMDERLSVLPVGETQKAKEDTVDCATRGPINDLEAKFTWLLRKGLLTPDNEAWLRANGYFQGDRVVFSDAFIAILSGTTRQGNSLKAPLQAIRDNGLIPKPLMPLEDWMTWDAYHNPSRITQAYRNLGLEFKKRFTIEYEQVRQSQLPDLINKDLVVVAGYAWPDPVDGIYPDTGLPPNHCFLEVSTPLQTIFDNYPETPGDYVKQLAPNYTLYDYGYRVYIASQQAPATIEAKQTFIKALWAQVVALLAQLTALKNETVMPPVVQPPKYLWDTKENARHSVRVICDEEGLSLNDKNIITACIQQESNFSNKAVCRNKDKSGKVVSSDWGICQVNDYYHVGQNKQWPSVQYILDNPDQVVRWMIKMKKAGQLKLWVSYSSDAYKKYMP